MRTNRRSGSINAGDPPGLSRRSFLGTTAGALMAAGAGGVLLAGCGGSEDAAGDSGIDEVTFLTIIPLNLGFISELLGDINGHFKREGLKVTIQSTRGSAQALQSILQGSAMISRVGAIETVLHNAKSGAPLINVGMQWRSSPIGIVSAPEQPLRKPADWRGTTLGIPSEGGTSEITFDLMMKNNGVEPDSVKRQVTGFSVGTYDLIEKGRIDSYVVGSVERVLFPLKNPEAIVVAPADYVEEGQCYVTSRQQLEEKRDQVQAYMNVVRKTMDDVLNDQDKDYKTIIEAVRKKHDFDELKDEKAAKGILEQQVEAWSFGGEKQFLRTVPESWQKVYDQLVKVGQVEGGKNPSEWFTNDLVPKG